MGSDGKWVPASCIGTAYFVCELSLGQPLIRIHLSLSVDRCSI